MNHDENLPDLTTLIDPVLEARVVAWVSGEASPFEAAELTRLTGEKPELAIFKRRIEAVRGLVAEAIRPDPEPLRLAPERRANLLQALGAPENKTPPAKTTSTPIYPLVAGGKTRRKNRRWMFALAACLMVGLFSVVSVQYQRGFEAHKSMRSPPSEPAALYFNLPAPEPESNYPSDPKQLGQIREQRKSEERREYGAKKEADIRSRQSARPAALAKERAAAPAAAPASPLSFRGNSNSDNITLSPFVVSAVEDAGYAATDTLAGSRVRADYSDKNKINGQLADQAGAGTSAGKKEFNASALGGLALEKKADASKLAEEQTVVLSPFTVSTDKKGGREAGESSDVPQIVMQESDGESTNPDPVPAKRPAPQPEAILSEVNASKEPVSTFSLHVSDVSFRLAQAALAKGETVDRASIRPEEFYNAFSYGDPTPALAEKVSCRIEQAAHPFVQQRNLVRIAVKVAAAGRDAAQPLHLTVLLDTSGSMEREDRAATIHGALQALVSLLGPNDRLTLIGFARQPRLLAESLPGDRAGEAVNILTHTPAEGGTNLEEALKLGGELAHRQFDPAAQNRIVLLTDGAANLGNANPAQLAASIEALRQQGIAFDACGVGLEGLDDGMLENLTRKGDGRYYVLNSPEAADAGFAKQLAGAFRPAAENVKLQVRFNPARVGHYRLIGFEQHRLREEDFRNDKVDAAELAAEEAAVAIYQVEPLPQGEGELGEVYVRFRDASSGNMVERSWTLNYDAQAPAFDRAAPTIQLAGTAALLAEKLQGGEAAAAINLSELAPVVNKLRSHYAHEPRVQELVTMFEQARKLSGE